MKKTVQKNLLGILEKAVRAEVERNEKNILQYCPVIVHQPKRPKKFAETEG